MNAQELELWLARWFNQHAAVPAAAHDAVVVVAAFDRIRLAADLAKRLQEGEPLLDKDGLEIRF
jgi:hypothetical protein